MPEVAEPPPQLAPVQPEYVPPQVPEPEKPVLKVKAGDVFKREFEKLTKAEASEKAPEPEKPVETPKDEPKPPVTAEPEAQKQDEKPAEKPVSPLDVVTADEKVKEEPDVLKEFDDKNPNWKNAREVMKRQSEEIKSFKSKLAELEKAPKAQPDEILALSKAKEELEQRLQKQEESLKALNYQYSDTFQKMVADRDAQVSKIQARVERYGGDSEKIMAALAMPDGRAKSAQIKEALAEVDQEDRTRIHTLLESLDEKNEKLTEEAKNSSSRWDELQTKRNAELAEQNANGLKALETDFLKIASELPNTVKTLREVPDDVPDAQNWNAEIKAARETGLRVLTPGGADAKESMEVAIKGGRYDSLEARYLALHKDWVERGKRLAEYDSGGPDFKGGDKPKQEQKLTPTEKYWKTLAREKGSPTD